MTDTPGHVGPPMSDAAMVAYDCALRYAFVCACKVIGQATEDERIAALQTLRNALVAIPGGKLP